MGGLVVGTAYKAELWVDMVVVQVRKVGTADMAAVRVCKVDKADMPAHKWPLLYAGSQWRVCAWAVPSCGTCRGRVERPSAPPCQLR